ncbi:MAG: ATP-binding cassette domain-containing protein [Dehalococcoidia bacterium]|nr:ATP-binding cassette domain-containing protein [Dehalococcoidia bacterium]
MECLETKGLTYVYSDGTKALIDVNFQVRAGEKVAVVGPNGAGKSTLFLHFNGILSPTKGRVSVDGEEVSQSNLVAVRSKVGIVFQNPDDQIFAPNVAQDIAFGPRNLGLSEGEVQDRVRYVAEVLGIEGILHKSPHNLSGGQKKRVAIAGVLAMDTHILIFDEPTSGLDHGGVEDLMGTIEKLNIEGKTILISTHDMELVSAWADRIYVMNKGSIQTCGTPQEIFSDPELLKENQLKVPSVVQTYRELEVRGICNGRIPLTVRDLVETITAGRQRRIDLGQASDRGRRSTGETRVDPNAPGLLTTSTGPPSSPT